MSLSDRVRQAGNAQQDVAYDALPAVAAELRRRVQSILPADSLAREMEGNPQRAENELRLACARAFEEGEWAGVDAKTRAELVDDLVDTVFGLGPLQSLLDDDSVTEIMVNGTSSLYCERGGRLQYVGSPFNRDDQVRALIDRIIAPLGRRIDEASPMVDARLGQGHRVHAVIPPLALDGPVLTIRKFRNSAITLEEMTSSGSFDAAMERFLRWQVALRRNIAVTGGTGSGKTTLLNALSCCIAAEERIVTIEDSAELRFTEHPHVVRLEARGRNAEGTGEVTIRDLVKNSLRMRPDRIVVGECRGPEALDMLQSMNTGHDGSLTTLHANTPADAIMRLSTMVRFAADLPIDVIESQIACALDCIIQTARGRDGSRFVRDVAQVGFDSEKRRAVVIPLYVWDVVDGCGSWRACPPWLDEAAAAGSIERGEVAAWKRQVGLPC